VANVTGCHFSGPSDPTWPCHRERVLPCSKDKEPELNTRNHAQVQYSFYTRPPTSSVLVQRPLANPVSFRFRPQLLRPLSTPQHASTARRSPSTPTPLQRSSPRFLPAFVGVLLLPPRGYPSGLGLSSPFAGKEDSSVCRDPSSRNATLFSMDAWFRSVRGGLFAWRSASGSLFVQNFWVGFKFSRTPMPDVKFARDQLSRDWSSCVASQGIWPFAFEQMFKTCETSAAARRCRFMMYHVSPVQCSSVFTEESALLSCMACNGNLLPMSYSHEISLNLATETVTDPFALIYSVLWELL